MRYVTFDLEIARVLPEDVGSMKAHRPLGITCAASVDSERRAKLYHPPRPEDIDAPYAPQIGPEHARRIVDDLVDAQNDGYVVVTWNGAGFDFDVLAEECQDDEYTEIVKALALKSIDPFFTFFCLKGYAKGLNAAAQGYDLEGKTEGMSGVLAPAMWREGREAQERVLDYVMQDALVTAKVFDELVVRGEFVFVSKRGHRYAVDSPTGSFGMPIRVSDAIQLPQPDTSWMNQYGMTPWTREKFIGWLQ